MRILKLFTAYEGRHSSMKSFIFTYSTYFKELLIFDCLILEIYVKYNLFAILTYLMVFYI